MQVKPKTSDYVKTDKKDVRNVEYILYLLKVFQLK